jgi:DNA invertase Pin-like site-specific DNA recombinase
MKSTYKTTAIYIRSSDCDAIKKQENTIREYFSERSNAIDTIQVYSETDRNSRSVFQGMMEDLKTGRISAVASLQADRLDLVFDDHENAIRFLAILESKSVRFIAVDDDFDTQKCGAPYGELLRLVRAAKATLRAERAREGLALAKESGKTIGRPTNGFDNQVRSLRSNGETIRGIALQLGIPASTVQSILERSKLPLEV